MRTTITLDEDVYHKLRAEMRKSGRSLRETVNESLRVGLTRRKTGPRKPFEVRNIGFRLGLDFESAGDLIERLEGPRHR